VLSRTTYIFTYFVGLEFATFKFKYFQGPVGTLPTLTVVWRRSCGVILNYAGEYCEYCDACQAG